MKIDLHVHTSELSLCGKLSIEKTLSLYQQTDYDAIVVTDHFTADTGEVFTARGIPDYIEYYFECQQHAVELGKKCNFTVLPGCELRFKQNINDYLVYGLTLEHVRMRPDIFDMTPAEFSEFAGAHGILFYQAHPFRNGMTVTNPGPLFGIEVMNNHPRHDSRNDIAQHWAEKYNLHRIGGSDCHQLEDVGTAGIVTDFPVKNIDDLIHVLRNDLYTIFHT